MGARPSSLAKRGLFFIALPLVFQLLLLFGVVFTERARDADNRAAATSKELKAAGYHLLGLVVDAETGMRGYVLTSNALFTEPYRNAVIAIPEELTRLRAIDPSRNRDLDSLQALAFASLDFDRSSVEAVQRGAGSGVVTLIRAEVGKKRTDLFRQAIARFIASIDRDDARRELAARRSGDRVTALMAAGIVANIVIAALMLRRFQASVTRRLATLIDNTRRIVDGSVLNLPVGGDDEIAEVDENFHTMAQRLLAARSQIEAAMRELESFSYSVSHDLRAPLRAVSGYAQMLREDYSTALDAEGMRYLTNLQTEATRMGALIDDLLSFSRLTRQAVSSADLDMNKMVDEVMSSLRGTTGGKEIVMRRDALPPARGDRAMIRQVLANLLGNAVKFSSHRPVIEIEMTATADAKEIAYTICDHGAGFDMRFEKKLFQIFERLHSADEFEGTGVGLALVDRIVRRHGGRVWAEGEVGKGACFHFTLPSAGTEEKVS